MQKTHTLKTCKEYFQQSLDGIKPFEIRLDDRGYKAGDVVVLAEYDNETRKYTDRYISGTIGAVTDFAQKPGYVVFSILGMKNF